MAPKDQFVEEDVGNIQELFLGHFKGWDTSPKSFRFRRGFSFFKISKLVKVHICVLQGVQLARGAALSALFRKVP